MGPPHDERPRGKSTTSTPSLPHTVPRIALRLVPRTVPAPRPCPCPVVKGHVSQRPRSVRLQLRRWAKLSVPPLRLVKISRVVLMPRHRTSHTFTNNTQPQARTLLESASLQPPTQNKPKLFPRRRPLSPFREDRPASLLHKRQNKQDQQTTTMSAVRQIAYVTHTVVRPAAKTHVRRLSNSASSGGPPTVSKSLFGDGKFCSVCVARPRRPTFRHCLCALQLSM